MYVGGIVSKLDDGGYYTYVLWYADGNYSGGDYYGGGMSCVSVSPTIRNCVITGNFGRYGGGMYLEQSGPAVINCMFADNTAELRGGAIYNWEDYYGSFALRVTNCVFSGNKSEDGGAVYNFEDCRPEFINCTFAGNDANNRGGAIYNWDSWWLSPAMISNCILWDNNAVGDGNEIYNANSNVPVFRYCDIKGCGGSGGEREFSTQEPEFGIASGE